MSAGALGDAPDRAGGDGGTAGMMAFLRYGLTFIAGMIAGAGALVAAFIFVVGGSIGVSIGRVPGPLDDVAVGDMRRFATVEAAPAQTNAVLTLADGGQTSLVDYRGKIVLVNYWASWCAPCLAEMPALDQLQGRMKSDDFEVVIIAIDTSYHASLAAYRKLDLEHLTFMHADPDLAYPRASGQPLNMSLPLTILYDRNGFEIGRLAGEAEWNTDAAVALIRAAGERF